jgi:hypothetical protein
MREGMTKNSAGIGGKCECTGTLGGFVSITGGTELQRRHERNYSKTDHKAAAKVELNPIPPLLNISEPRRVF